MNRILLAIGGLLVGLLALLFVAPAVVDWNRYRGIFEEEASRFLGRELRVGGKVNLRLLPVPYVRFEKVRIADTSANVGRPLFMADDFTVWLSVGALLGGGIEAKAIELRRPVVTLVLDGKGGGNWSSLVPRQWTAALGPTRISFDAVRFTDGRIDILSPAGEPRSSFAHINGELSAAALDGPYKVAAAFAIGGEPRELRLSTAKPAEDGTVRMKGTIRDPATGTSYSLDGSVHNALGATRLAGELTARLPLPSMLEAPQGAAAARRQGGDFDVRAQVTADTSGMQLKDLSLSFEQAGRPQLAVGEAHVTWSDRTDVTLALKSHWLDLDRIAAGEETARSPLRIALTLAKGLSRVLATEGRTQATLAIEQATLGSDVVSGLSATLDQTQGKLAVRDLAVALPGGARLSVNGAFDLKDAEPGFDGRVSLRGASLTRFLGWAARGQRVGLPAQDGPFSLLGDIAFSAATVSGRNLSLQIGRNALTGEARWRTGEAREIVVNLEGSELDLTPMLDEGLAPVDAMRRLLARLAGSDEVRAPGTASPAAPGGANAEVRLRVDRLVAGTTVFRDAAGELRLVGGNLSIPQLRLGSDDGYALELRGDIADLAQRAARGTLTGHVTANRPAGLAALAQLAGLPADLRPSPEAVAASGAVRLRLAGRLQVGLRGPGTQDLGVDGDLGTSRLTATLRLGPEAATWRERAADLGLVLDGRDLPRLLAGVAPALAAPQGDRLAGGLRIVLRGVGTAKSGIASLAAVTAEGINTEYRGRLSIDDIGAVAFDGDVSLDLADLARGLALAGLPPQPLLKGPALGSIKLTRSADKLTLATDRLVVAGSTASGRLVVDPGPGGITRLAGDIKLDTASLPGLLAALGSTRQSGRQAEAQAAGAPSPWSDAPIDLGFVDRLAGSRIKLEIARLALTPGVAVQGARLDLTARTGGLVAQLAEAKALGGQASGLLALERAPAGVKLAIEARLAGARLEALSSVPAAEAPAAGGLAFSVKGTSAALTPRGLVVALAGQGEIAIDRAASRRWSPAAVSAAADAIIALKGEAPPGALRQMLELALAKEGIALGSPRLGLTLADGAVRAQPLTLATPKGRLTGNLAIDLDTQRFDGEWRIEPRGPAQPADAPPKPDLPAITIVYAGPFARLGAIEPRLDIEALEREVIVRKVEREVAELERLRRLDEERARQEAERIARERQLEEQRRLEAQQRAAAAAPGAGATPGDTGAPAAAPQSAAPATAGDPQPPVPIAPPVAPAGAPPPSASVITLPPAAGPADPATAASTVAPSQPAAGSLAPPLAVPPSTVEIAPITPPKGQPRPRPAQAPTKLDPFRQLRESGGG